MTNSTQLTDEIKAYIDAKFAQLKVSGDQVQGGIIADFSSTGIDDKSSNCVLTLLDDMVVCENNFLTKDLTVKGNLIVDGTVPEESAFFKHLSNAVTDRVNSGLNTDLFLSFADSVTAKIKAEGIDLNKITIDGKPAIDGTTIGFSVIESHLQRVGVLRDLQVAGETVLASTLYVAKGRVGVNTLEPSAALSVWDQEVEVTVSKQAQGHAKIGTPRSQPVTLSSNNKQNVVLNVDGSTTVAELRIGSIKISSAPVPPSFTSTIGHIVFNTNPTLGGPLGWVCLGAANWANFGILD